MSDEKLSALAAIVEALAPREAERFDALWDAFEEAGGTIGDRTELRAASAKRNLAALEAPKRKPAAAKTI